MIEFSILVERVYSTELLWDPSIYVSFFDQFAGNSIDRRIRSSFQGRLWHLVNSVDRRTVTILIELIWGQTFWQVVCSAASLPFPCLLSAFLSCRMQVCGIGVFPISRVNKWCHMYESRDTFSGRMETWRLGEVQLRCHNLIRLDRLLMVRRVIHVCGTPHLHAWHGTVMYFTWLARVCGTTCLPVWHQISLIHRRVSCCVYFALSTTYYHYDLCAIGCALFIDQSHSACASRSLSYAIMLIRT